MIASCDSALIAAPTPRPNLRTHPNRRATRDGSGAPAVGLSCTPAPDRAGTLGAAPLRDTRLLP
ncbi:MAG: hypothetical protein IPK67_08850 [Planctomycetes bacterium]|nr:hypothetical protein [Planctomycetota bacterium]